MDKAVRERTPLGDRPERVAETALRAATTRRPASRYRVGATSRGLVLGRRFVSDRVWDAAMARQFRDPAA